MIQGKLYIISAPSGTGKSSLIQNLVKTQQTYNIQVSISHTTRAIRPKERNGKHYFFVSVAEFEQMIAEDEFLEYAQVFGNYYGTARKNVEQSLKNGIDIFLDINWQGAQQIRHKIPDTCSIFILPPSKEELVLRLRNRGQDSEKIIAQRMAQAVTEMNHFTEYDYLIINDNFKIALFNLKTILRAERLHLKLQKIYYNTLIKKLLLE